MRKIISKTVVASLLLSVLSINVLSTFSVAEAYPYMQFEEKEKVSDKYKRPAPPVRKPEKGPSKNMPPIYRPPEHK